METRQGKIEEKNLKFAANKAPYATFTIDGMNYNSFDKEIVDNHNPDDYVEFTGEVNAKGFWELKTMKKIDAITIDADVAKPVNGAKEYHLSPEEVKCRALECSMTMHLAMFEKGILGNNIPVILETADKFVEWIYGN